MTLFGVNALYINKYCQAHMYYVAAFSEISE